MAYTIIMLISSMVSISMGSSRINTADHGQSKDSVIHCGCICMATIYARVVDRNGREVSGLLKNDFRVYEDGVIQTIDVFIENANQDKTMPARYVMSYSPRYREFDGKYHKLRVILNSKDRGKYQVKVFPRGYHATAIKVPCNDVRGALRDTEARVFRKCA